MLCIPAFLALLTYLLLPGVGFPLDSEIPPGSPAAAYLSGTETQRALLPKTEIPQIESSAPEPKTLLLDRENDSLEPILKVGARALAWKNHLRRLPPRKTGDSQSQRSSPALNLETQESAHSYGPENPEVFNPKILTLAFERALRNCHEMIRTTLLDFQNFPLLPDDFLVELHSTLNQMDRLYALALRYRSLIQQKEKYIRASRWDFRHFLQIGKDPQAWLNRTRPFFQLTSIEKNELKALGVSLCQNATGESPQACKAHMNRHLIHQENLELILETWRYGAQKNFDSLFVVSSERERRDLVFSELKSGLQISLPFLEVSDMHYKNLLVDAAHTYWKRPDPPIFLSLRFQPGVQSLPFFSWLPWLGKLPRLTLLPHAQTATLFRGRHNSEIILNSSISPLDANLKWQVAHELGHVLGFPDCYVEFYDTNREAFVQYSLEKSNIMCETGGQAQSSHFQNLKKFAGLKPSSD